MLYFTTVILALTVSGAALRGLAPPERVSSKGKLKGVVMDWQDARMPGTQVLIRSSKFKAEVKASEAGEFETDVPVGVYEVSVQREGFKEFRQKGVKVEASKTTSVKIQLKTTPTRIKMPRDGIYL